MTHTIRIIDKFGSFLSDGERGNQFRFCELEPAVSKRELVILDFEGVTNMTDSFANACFGHFFRHMDFQIDGKVVFKNCTPTIKSFIGSAWNFAQKQAIH